MACKLFGKVDPIGRKPDIVLTVRVAVVVVDTIEIATLVTMLGSAAEVVVEVTVEVDVIVELAFVTVEVTVVVLVVIDGGNVVLTIAMATLVEVVLHDVVFVEKAVVGRPNGTLVPRNV